MDSPSSLRSPSKNSQSSMSPTKPTHMSFGRRKIKNKPPPTIPNNVIFGVLLSVCISMCIAGAIAYSMHMLVPIIANYVKQALKEASSPRPIQKIKESQYKILQLKLDLTGSLFRSSFASKQPALFRASNEAAVRELAVNHLINFTVPLCQFPQLVEKECATSDITFPLSELNNMIRQCSNTDTCTDTEESSLVSYIHHDSALEKLLQRPFLCHDMDMDTKNTCDFNDDAFASFTDNKKMTVVWSRPSHSGSSFLRQGEVWHECLAGKVHWVLYRAQELPTQGFSPHHNLHHWLQTVYYTLINPPEAAAAGTAERRKDSMWSSSSSSERTAAAEARAQDTALHVYQEAGQVLYIPSGWYSALAGVADMSVTVSAGKSTQQRDMASADYYLAEALKKTSAGDSAGAARLLRIGLAMQPCFDLYLLLGAAEAQQGRLKEAEQAYRHTIRLNARYAPAYAQLINNVLLMMSSDSTGEAVAGPDGLADSSGAVAQLLLAAEAVGVKQLVLQILNDMT